MTYNIVALNTWRTVQYYNFMLGQRFYNMLGQRLYNMFGQRLYNMLGQRFLDEQSADGFASPNQRWPKENCSLRLNVGPTSTCYLGGYLAHALHVSSSVTISAEIIKTFSISRDF